MRVLVLVLGLTMSATRLPGQPSAVVQVAPNEVEAHVRHTAPPVYPPIAVAARVEGTVTVAAVVSPSGAVEAATAMRSIPLLDQAAIDAVKLWRFAAFEVNGQPVRFLAEIDIPFYLDQATAALATSVRDKSRDCRAFLDAKRFDEAEADCAAAANMAAKLPAPDRASAYHLAGRMLVGRGQLPKAIEAFEAELKLRGAGADESLVAAAHQALAGAHAAGNDVKNARREYDQAEKIGRSFSQSVERQIAYIHAEPAVADLLRRKAAALLRSVLTDYVDALRKAGLDADAARVQQRLAALPPNG